MPGAPPLVDWSDHLDSWRWDQGDHVTLIGPTKAGKTTAAMAFLPVRDYIVVLACKPRDVTLMTAIRRDGYRIVHKWSDVTFRRGGDRVVLWPKGKGPDEFEAAQFAEFRECLRDVFEVGGWAVYCDELSYLSDYLGLDRPLNRLWAQGRSLGVSMIAGTQAPVYVPRNAYDQVMHLYLWRQRDARRIRTLADISGAVDPAALMRDLGSLREHEVLYVDGSTGETRRTIVDDGSH